MRLTPSGGRTAPGPADWFTGTVFVDGIRDPDDRSAIGCAHVRFAPGARTAWHTHPKGQTLYVTDGIGYVATRRDGVQEIRPGDVVHIAPGEEHWHGATPDRFMAHVAMQQADEIGQVVTWLDHVIDDEYGQDDQPGRRGSAHRDRPLQIGHRRWTSPASSSTYAEEP